MGRLRGEEVRRGWEGGGDGEGREDRAEGTRDIGEVREELDHFTAVDPAISLNVQREIVLFFVTTTSQ